MDLLPREVIRILTLCCDVVTACSLSRTCKLLHEIFDGDWWTKQPTILKFTSESFVEGLRMYRKLCASESKLEKILTLLGPPPYGYNVGSKCVIMVGHALRPDWYHLVINTSKATVTFYFTIDSIDSCKILPIGVTPYIVRESDGIETPQYNYIVKDSNTTYTTSLIYPYTGTIVTLAELSETYLNEIITLLVSDVVPVICANDDTYTMS